jgi:hypothetical protein
MINQGKTPIQKAMPGAGEGDTKPGKGVVRAAARAGYAALLFFLFDMQQFIIAPLALLGAPDSCAPGYPVSFHSLSLIVSRSFLSEARLPFHAQYMEGASPCPICGAFMV